MKENSSQRRIRGNTSKDVSAMILISIKARKRPPFFENVPLYYLYLNSFCRPVTIDREMRPRRISQKRGVLVGLWPATPTVI